VYWLNRVKLIFQHLDSVTLFMELYTFIASPNFSWINNTHLFPLLFTKQLPWEWITMLNHHLFYKKFSATLRFHDLMTLQHYNYYSSTLWHDNWLRCYGVRTLQLYYSTWHYNSTDSTKLWHYHSVSTTLHHYKSTPAY